jgi:hypothetical protein
MSSVPQATDNVCFHTPNGVLSHSIGSVKDAAGGEKDCGVKKSSKRGAQQGA